MNAIPNCPECGSSYVYEDRELYICPECGYEFSKVSLGDDEGELVVCDANGTKLEDGDSVSIIKDLKVKNSSTVVKVGTKVKNIRLVDGDHNLDCKVPGIGQMGLKSEFVKKVTQ